ncbi:unnamed protein product, partial [Chrysoparadoxa australica]
GICSLDHDCVLEEIRSCLFDAVRGDLEWCTLIAKADEAGMELSLQIEDRGEFHRAAMRESDGMGEDEVRDSLCSISEYPPQELVRAAAACSTCARSIRVVLTSLKRTAAGRLEGKDRDRMYRVELDIEEKGSEVAVRSITMDLLPGCGLDEYELTMHAHDISNLSLKRLRLTLEDLREPQPQVRSQ